MVVFAAKWAFFLLPAPLVIWALLPPFHEVTKAVRMPFFEQATEAAGIRPRAGAVVRKPNWMQRLLGPLCWVLLITALARPQWVEPPLEKIEAARDLMLAIDLSQSMEARDFRDASGRRVDRLTAVKVVVDDFIDRRKTDRIGLIAFGQAAFPQAPLTLDHDSIKRLLDELRIGMAGPQTAIGDAIGLAIRMTERSKMREKVLVLLTDGNDTASKVPPDKAAQLAKMHGITIHTIGIGDPRASGEDKVDLEALKKISTQTGGRAFRGENRASLEDIYATIDRTTPDKAKRFTWSPHIDLFWIPVGIAALLHAAYHAIALLALYLRRLIPRREAA